MMIVLPYIYGEYSYRQHLGTLPMQCVKVWEEEHCRKGRNCSYEQNGRMLYDNGETSVFSGTYSVGSWYVDESKWEFLDHNTNKEPSNIAKIAQMYRWLANIFLILFGVVGTFMLAISTFIWLAFKTRYKTPLSFWVLQFNEFDLDSNYQRQNMFMDENPFWFHKEER
jgi:hypothetical protein